MMEKEKLDSSLKDPDCIEDVDAEAVDALVPEHDEQETAKILRKVDWRLLPMLTILFVISFVDRSNGEP